VALHQDLLSRQWRKSLAAYVFWRTATILKPCTSGPESPSLILLLAFWFLLLNSLAKHLDARPKALSLDVEFCYSLLRIRLLVVYVVECALEFGFDNCFSFVSSHPPAQDRLSWNVPHSPLNILFSRVKLSFVIRSLLNLVFEFREAFLIEQKLNRLGVSLCNFAKPLHFAAQRVDLGGEQTNSLTHFLAGVLSRLLIIRLLPLRRFLRGAIDLRIWIQRLSGVLSMRPLKRRQEQSQ